MATMYALNGSLDTLGAVLQGTGTTYFNSIDVQRYGNASIKYMTCTTTDGLTFQLGGFYSGYGYSHDDWAIQAASGSTDHTRDPRNDKTDYLPGYAYVCEKGVSIVCYCGRILITKTNNNKTVVAFGDYTPGTDASSIGVPQKTAHVMSRICCIADGDGDTYKFFINNTNNDNYDRLFNQTLIIPIPSQPAFETVSYTNHAGLILLPQTRDICNFTYNNKRYFSDGYFAIEDAAS